MVTYIHIYIYVLYIGYIHIYIYYIYWLHIHIYIYIYWLHIYIYKIYIGYIYSYIYKIYIGYIHTYITYILIIYVCIYIYILLSFGESNNFYFLILLDLLYMLVCHKITSAEQSLSNAHTYTSYTNSERKKSKIANACRKVMNLTLLSSTISKL